jgi:adenosylcobinamide-phosphate synthase
MSAALVPLVAFLLDAAFGEPPNLAHPVAWMGKAIARGRAWAMRGGRVAQFVRGTLVALGLPVACAALARGIVSVAARAPWLAIVVLALALKPMFAVRALRDAAFHVRDALLRGDVSAARRGLASLCSRDASELDEAALVAATIESVAENTSDSIVAPLFYFACFGLPGATFYRAANTVDSMMGYHGELEWAGKAGARLDDVLNLLPSRLTVVLLIVAGWITGERAWHGAAIAWRDGALTESPNAGRPMAAMAGLLGVRLAKPGHYSLGDCDEVIDPGHITRAWRVASIASVLVTVLSASLGFALFATGIARG